jgi:hypothetical protein
MHFGKKAESNRGARKFSAAEFAHNLNPALLSMMPREMA